MKKILVTGATGRVGRRFVPRLLQRENAVRILVRRAEQAEPFRQLGAEVVIGDLSQPESVAEAVSGVDTVVHLAAFFRGTDQELVRATNEEGALALAQASIKAGVERFAFTSTNLVYGPGRGRSAREDDEPQPRFTYPITKSAAEQTLLELHRTQGLGLRIYGWHLSMEKEIRTSASSCPGSASITRLSASIWCIMQTWGKL